MRRKPFPDNRVSYGADVIFNAVKLDRHIFVVID